MGQDGNTIEIEIDAAATVAAAKTAGEANAKLVKFDQALGLFRDNVGLVSKTTEDVATRLGDFNTILQKFADNLTTNLADMQTSVVQKIEPHLERELENMVNRVLNKVEAKTGTTGESRSRSEAKQGPAAVAATPANVATASQDTDYKKPEYRIIETIDERITSVFDEATGKMVETITTTTRTRTTATDHDQYEDEEGNLVDKTSTRNTYTTAVNKTNQVIAEGAKVEKDRGIAIRKEITGALIGLHVMKVVSQYSQVFNAGFMQIAAAMGHLLNNILLPMMPAFIIFAQALHTVANIIQMLPMPIRQLIGALLIWKATSMLVASMPLKDIKDGFAGIKQVMDGADTGFKKFIGLVRAFIDFMNSGQGKGAVSWIGSGLGKVGGAIGGGVKKLLHRAGGGPVLGHGAYIVGEKGPEIFVPKTSGSIIPNHKIGRADGIGDLAAAPTGSLLPTLGGEAGPTLGTDPLGFIGAGLGLDKLNPAGIADVVAGAVSSDLGINIIGTLNSLTGMLSAILAPIAPIMGVIGGVLGVVSGARGALGGGGADRTAETVAKVGTEQIKATGKLNFGIQNITASVGRATGKLLTLILLRLGAGIPLIGLPSLGFGELLDAIKDFIKGIKEFLERLKAKLEEFIKELKRLWDELKEKFREAWEELKRKLREAWDELKEKLKESWEELKKKLREAWDDLKTKLREAWEELKSKLRESWEELKTKLRESWEDLKTRLRGAWEDLKTKLRESWEEMKAKLRETFEDLKSRLRESWEELKSRLRESWSEMKSRIGEAFTELKERLSAAWEDLKTRLRESWEELKTKFRDSYEDLKTRLRGSWEELKSRLSGSWDELKTKLSGSWEELRAKLSTLGDVLKAKITGIIDYIELGRDALRSIDPLKIKEAFVEKLSVLPEKVTDFITRLKEFFTRSKVDVPVDLKPPSIVEAAWKVLGKGIGEFVGFAAVIALKDFFTTGKVDIVSIVKDLGIATAVLVLVEKILVGLATAVGATTVAAAITSAFATLGALMTPAIALAFEAIAVVALADLFQTVDEGIRNHDMSNLTFNLPGMQIIYEEGRKLGASFGDGIVMGTFKAIAGIGERVSNYMSGHGFRTTEEIQNLLKAGQTMPEIDANPDLKLSDLGIELDASGNFVRNLDKFNADFKQTTAGGIPVDVKIDTDSVTQTVQTVTQTISQGAAVPPSGTYPPPGGGTWSPTNPAAPPDPKTCPSGQIFDDTQGKCIDSSFGGCPPGTAWDVTFNKCRAGGGPVMGGDSYLVGEKGPELFKPSGSGEIIPNNKLGSVGGGGGGNTINFSPTFNVTSNNPRELTDTVMKELKMELARVKM